MGNREQEVRIRPVTVDDAEQLLEIYRPYVERTAITFEYEVPEVIEFRERIRKTLERYPYLAAVTDSVPEDGHDAIDISRPDCIGHDKGERILGYAYTGAFKERAAYDWAAETSIYVRWGCGKKGIGKMLYQALEEVSRRQHVINLNACIGVPLQAAEGSMPKPGQEKGEGAFLPSGDRYLTSNSAEFHEHMGFRLVGRFHRCGYKFGRWYDMVWMEKFLGPHPERPDAFIPYPDL